FRTIGGSFEDEKKLFGWGGESARKGNVKIAINKTLDLKNAKFSKIFNANGFPEPMGYNYISFSLDQRFSEKQTDKIQRKYFIENQKFILKITFSSLLTEEDIKKYLCALWCSIYLGNFGSRSRRGFGSLIVSDIKGDNTKVIEENFLSFIPDGNMPDWLKKNIEKIKSLFKFQNIKVYKIEKNNINKIQSWVDEVQTENDTNQRRMGHYLVNKYISNNSLNESQKLLNLMGFTLMAFRSYMKPDYDNAKSIIQGYRAKDNKIERAIFGLPINFFFSSIKKQGVLNPVKNENGKETNLRRASPIIFKVIANKNNNFEGFIILVKKEFLPINIKLKLKNTEIKKPDYTLMDKYINTLKSKQLIWEVL
ncbi:MAG: RAMP superfamily CRISPR-associated protein, partial [Spirochaetota bacterium]